MARFQKVLDGFGKSPVVIVGSFPQGIDRRRRREK